MKSSLIALMTLAASTTLPLSSHACGVCIEDKVAATYDYAVVTKAEAMHHLVVFCEIIGAVEMEPLTARIVALAPRVRGIDRGTLRTSASPAAISFALDPAVQAPASAVADLQKQLRTQGVRLRVVRVFKGEANAR